MSDRAEGWWQGGSEVACHVGGDGGGTQGPRLQLTAAQWRQQGQDLSKGDMERIVMQTISTSNDHSGAGKA